MAQIVCDRHRSMEYVLRGQKSIHQLRQTRSADSVLVQRRRSADMRLVAKHPDVYEPCDDSFALVDALLADRTNIIAMQPRVCIEIGCGSGYVVSSLALMLKDELDETQTHFLATDISPSATETTRQTLKVHGIKGVDIIQTDLISGLEKRLAGNVDLLVFNPPYVPTPEDEVGASGITGSWAGGDRGRAVIDRLLPVVDYIMSSKGCMYLVTLTANNPQEICRIMKSKGFASCIVVQRHTEEESLHVLKFWRENTHHSSSNSNFSGGESCGAGGSNPLLCVLHKFSRLWK